jgi:ferrochelatase
VQLEPTRIPTTFDAVVIVSFGGPEGPADVLPFLENVTRGRNVPRARLLEVAKHYAAFGGVSPLNAQNRALRETLAATVGMRVYLGNRNWHPLLADTVRRMRADGVTRALAFVTSAYASYSGCRQYRDDIDRARSDAGDGAPEIVKLRGYFNHPRFIRANRARFHDTVATLDGAALAGAHVLFTAHSVPTWMAQRAPYAEQLRETARLVMRGGPPLPWDLAYQSRSGPPNQPWLGPDVADRIRALAAAGTRAVIVHPIGFLSDHIEVLHDLDDEARSVAAAAGLRFARVPTVGTHPEFVQMIRDLIAERTAPGSPRAATGRLPAPADHCAVDCCAPPHGQERLAHSGQS